MNSSDSRGDVINKELSDDILTTEERRILYKRKSECELAKMEAEIRQIDAESKHLYADALEKEYTVKRRIVEDVTNRAQDDRDRVYAHDLERRLSDYMASQIITQNHLCSIEAPEHREISFPLVASEFGYKYNPTKQSQIGKTMAKLFRKRYDGREPPKRTVIYQGRPQPENAYWDEDLDIMRYSVMSHATNVTGDEVQAFAHEHGIDDLLNGN